MAVGERVVKLTHRGLDVKPEEEFDVVMNNYRGGYTMYKGKPVIKEIQTDMAELLANYFLEHKTVKATLNHVAISGSKSISLSFSNTRT
jgi:2',3'-cyclic-nucleotide 2'-phosphodiesterase / 3'-nucleotidase